MQFRYTRTFVEGLAAFTRRACSTSVASQVLSRRFCFSQIAFALFH